MRLMAHRVGPAGEVVGLDVDAGLGAMTEAMLRDAGHPQCEFQAHDFTVEAPVPGRPYDLVFARLLLFHLPQRVAVLRRLWDAVAPGGHLVVQDYDLRSTSVLPTLASVEETVRVLTGAFGAVGCDVLTGPRLPYLMAEAGIGAPDGTDVAGRIEPLGTSRPMLEQTLRSVLPAALAHGVTSEPEAQRTLAALNSDAASFADRPVMWPLLVGAWKRKR